MYRARILVASGNYTRAHNYYSRAFNYVKTLPENKISGEIYYLRGVAYKKEGRLKESLKMHLQAGQIFRKVGNLRYLEKIEQEIAGTKV